MDPIDKIFDFEAWLKKYKKLIPSEEEFKKREQREREKELSRFEQVLAEITEDTIGKKYTKDHLSIWADTTPEITRNIQMLLQTKRGAYYSGIPGSGKTHVILETFQELCRGEWLLYLQSHRDYPDPACFINRTCHYEYSKHIFDRFLAHERIPLAKYNLIDDLGVESIREYHKGDLDDYFEEMNRRDLGLVITSNIRKEDLALHPDYPRIFSRLQEKCRFFMLPAIDYRAKPENRELENRQPREPNREQNRGRFVCVTSNHQE